MNEKFKSLITFSRQKLIPFAIKRRFELLLAAVLLYFLWPHLIAGLHRSGEAEESRVVIGESAQNAKAQELPLYDPSSANADPKWSLPAELKSAELQSFATQVDKLASEEKRYSDLLYSRHISIKGLLSDDVKKLLWPALKGSGFKDQRLPMDWFNLIKDDYDKNQMVAELEDEQSRGMWSDVESRITSIQTRLLGGQVLAGDVLFSKTLQSYFDQRLGPLEENNDHLDKIFLRMQREFPNFQGGPPGISQNGFKWLEIGMKLEDLRSKYTISFSDKTNPVVKVTFDDSDYLLSVGSFPLKTLSAYFFKGQLCRISMTFDSNSQEIFDALGIGLCDNPNLTCLRANEYLVAKFKYDDQSRLCAAIVGRQGGNWDEIEIFDYAAWTESKQFYNPPGEFDIQKTVWRNSDQ